jgi:glycosyltransferase involved in cell wall biosynthesis
MALGIPSISTNVNAIPEAVKHLKTGWLIEAGDSGHLAKAFLELKKNKELRQKLANSGQDFVLENFNEKAVAEIALQGYVDSLNRSEN